MDLEQIRKAAFEMKPWLVETRRRLHRYPELGLHEFRTCDAIREALGEIGVPCEKLGGTTAVVGLVSGEGGGKTVAIRADMDALPLSEAGGSDFRSRTEGVMHACGHDAHMTILLGTAKLLSTMRGGFRGNVKLLFEPAEETVGGAEPMVKLGCMENPHVDYCIGLHVMPHVPVGSVELKYGALNGASDIFHFEIQGKNAHGAYPDLGTDAIVIAAHVITALQTLVSRNVSPLDSAVLTVGTIRGGERGNIIADKVQMDAILRTINPKTESFAVKRVAQIARGVAESLGGTAEVRVEEGYRALINDDGVVDLFRETAKEVLGGEHVVMREKPSLGVEDFSSFLNCCRGAFYHLGCAPADCVPGPALHTPGFFIDEECLPYGVLMHAAFALRLLERGAV